MMISRRVYPESFTKPLLPASSQAMAWGSLCSGSGNKWLSVGKAPAGGAGCVCHAKRAPDARAKLLPMPHATRRRWDRRTGPRGEAVLPHLLGGLSGEDKIRRLRTLQLAGRPYAWDTPSPPSPPGAGARKRYAPPRRCWPPVAAAHAFKVPRRLCRCHPLPTGDLAVCRPGGRARRFPWRRRLALALKRRDARPRRSGWPWSSSLRWRRVDRWRAGAGQWQARRRQGNGACSCLARVRGWRVVCTVGMRSAPFGPLWRLRSAPLEDSLRSASPPSPPGKL